MLYHVAGENQIEFTVIKRKAIPVELTKLYGSSRRIPVGTWVGQIDANMFLSDAKTGHLSDYRASATTHFKNALYRSSVKRFRKIVCLIGCAQASPQKRSIVVSALVMRVVLWNQERCQ